MNAKGTVKALKFIVKIIYKKSQKLIIGIVIVLLSVRLFPQDDYDDQNQ